MGTFELVTATQYSFDWPTSGATPFGLDVEADGDFLEIHWHPHGSARGFHALPRPDDCLFFRTPRGWTSRAGVVKGGDY